MYSRDAEEGKGGVVGGKKDSESVLVEVSIEFLKKRIVL
jgi:hypothetical protein